ncbi:MAG TPA: hypothetical protein VN924_22760 [Bryobacteraceae bacterium]|nr:hypothetical protein [Bryobacteraceae bacterium]
MSHYERNLPQSRAGTLTIGRVHIPILPGGELFQDRQKNSVVAGLSGGVEQVRWTSVLATVQVHEAS